MTLSRLVASAALALGLIQFGGRADAGITGLYNTGVDAAGNPLANGAVDSHYTFLGYSSNGQLPLSGAGSSYSVNPAPGTFPIPPWVPNDAVSTWISASPSITASTSVPNGYYVYETTFTSTSTGSISGMFTADDKVAYLLNPTSAPNASTLTYTPDQGYGSLYNFNISGVQAGTNDLYFIVDNTHNGPEGLRVEYANAVPEPASVAMLGLGLVGVAGRVAFRRRRNRALATA